MKTCVWVVVTALTVSLTGYVTTKAGWFSGRVDRPYALKAMQVQSAEQLEDVMNTTAAKIYRSGQGTAWKMAMLYR